MVVRQQPAINLECLFVKRLSGCVSTLLKVRRQVPVACGRIGVVIAEQLAADLKRLLVQGLGRRVPALRAEVVRQVVIAKGRRGVIVAEQPAIDLERFFKQRLRGRVLSLRRKVGREVVVAASGRGVVVAEQAAIQFERLLKERLGGRISLSPEIITQVRVGCGGGLLVLGSQAAADFQRFSCSGWASANFPRASRLIASQELLLAVSAWSSPNTRAGSRCLLEERLSLLVFALVIVVLGQALLTPGGLGVVVR